MSPLREDLIQLRRSVGLEILIADFLEEAQLGFTRSWTSLHGGIGSIEDITKIIQLILYLISIGCHDWPAYSPQCRVPSHLPGEARDLECICRSIRTVLLTHMTGSEDLWCTYELQ